MKTTSLVLSWICLGFGAVLVIMNFVPLFGRFSLGNLGGILIAAAVISLAIHTSSRQ